ncbi:MAG: WG repeat-containing protein, partial [Saprospiraceae bacterium]|nr:WG repeat-containing protein [Saprospiraceae bacterium]
MRIKYLIPLSLAAGAEAAAQTPAAPSAQPEKPGKSRSNPKIVQRDIIQLASKQLGIPVEKIQPSSHFVKDLGLDSLDAVELVMACEEWFQIVIADAQAEKAHRIADLVRVVLDAPAKPPADPAAKMTIQRFKKVTEGLYVGEVEGKKSASNGLLYADGRVLLPPTYDDIYFFSEGHARVWLNKLAGVIDSTGKLVIPLQYAGLADCHNGFFAAAVRADSTLLWGLLDLQGKPVIDFQYEAIQSWDGYWLPVKKAGRWAFVNLRNEIMADPGYTQLRALRGVPFGAE